MKKSIVIMVCVTVILVVGFIVYSAFSTSLAVKSNNSSDSVQNNSSGEGNRVLAPGVHQLESKDLKITFTEELYSSNFDGGSAVQNYPPLDTGTESLGMMTQSDWIIKVKEGFVYDPATNKCESPLEKTTLNDRLLTLCQDGFGHDQYGENMFVFDESSKTMIWIIAASPAAKGAALDAIRGGLQWK